MKIGTSESCYSPQGPATVDRRRNIWSYLLSIPCGNNEVQSKLTRTAVNKSPPIVARSKILKDKYSANTRKITIAPFTTSTSSNLYLSHKRRGLHLSSPPPLRLYPCSSYFSYTPSLKATPVMRVPSSQFRPLLMNRVPASPATT